MDSIWLLPIKPLQQFVGQVLRLQRHLPGDVQCDGVRAMFVEDGAQASGGGVDGRAHVDLSGVALTLAAQVGVAHAARRGDGLGAGGAFGAQPAEVTRVLLITEHFAHRAIFHLHDDAAANAAIGTDTPNIVVCHATLLNRKRKTPWHPPS